MRKAYRPLTLFDLFGLGAGMGTLLGTDATTGGYVIGGIFVITVAFATFILASKLEARAASGPSFMLGSGLIMAVLFGWWPVWAVLVAALFILFGMLGLFGGKGE